MTVAEFLEWDSGDASGARWQLRDGEPEKMAPASNTHAVIQGNLFVRLANHFAETQSPCRALTGVGVVPGVQSDHNALIPDLTITCAPIPKGYVISEPRVLIEILSPRNEAQTRANVWGFLTIPSVCEIVLVSSMAVGVEILSRGPNGEWPARPETLKVGGELRIESIAFGIPVAEIYAETDLLNGAPG